MHQASCKNKLVLEKRFVHFKLHITLSISYEFQKVLNGFEFLFCNLETTIKRLKTDILHTSACLVKVIVNRNASFGHWKERCPSYGVSFLKYFTEKISNSSQTYHQFSSEALQLKKVTSKIIKKQLAYRKHSRMWQVPWIWCRYQADK